MDHVNILHTACEKCLLKPEHSFTIKDVWNCFGENWDIENIPTLNLDKIILLVICLALKKNDYCQSRAAKDLGISPRSLSYHLDKYSIRSDKFKKKKPQKKCGERDIQKIIEKGDLYEWIGILK